MNTYKVWLLERERVVEVRADKWNLVGDLVLFSTVSDDTVAAFQSSQIKFFYRDTRNLNEGGVVL